MAASLCDESVGVAPVNAVRRADAFTERLLMKEEN
jgi:hypothetical protein